MIGRNPMLGTDYRSLQGKTVYGSDGEKIGKIADLYDDDSGGAPLFATVNTGLFGLKTTFIPLAQAEARGDDVVVPYTKDFVKGAPNVEADAELSPQEEQEIFAYYGLGGGTAATAGTGQYATGGYESGGRHEAAEELRAEGGWDRDREGVRGQGRDVSGPTTDEAMTRSEERVRVSTEQVEAGRARLRKYIVTENVTRTVPVSHEEIRVEREPITDANVGDALSGPELSEEEHEVTLHAERPVVQKETVPVERVR
ncbi:MAG TPA: PRC and DUF2382 domain-containing protein, partial [Frankiaceae bacterium]|nr:PRC and DUF2382 domain-containing protein [Frankiaceae bacterium]